jgi:hypothetical protein
MTVPRTSQDYAQMAQAADAPRFMAIGSTLEERNSRLPLRLQVGKGLPRAVVAGTETSLLD